MVIALVIIGGLVLISFFAGMGDDFWNTVNAAAVLAASLVLIIVPFCIKDEVCALFAKAVAGGESKLALYSFLFALIYIAVGFALGSPLIWAWKEKEYYLILGTLASKTNYSAGLGIAIMIGGILGLPAGFCFKAAAPKASVGLLLVPAAVAVVISLVTFILLVVKYRQDN